MLAIVLLFIFHNLFSRLVPYPLIDKHNFLTISTKGVTHNLEGNMFFTPLEEWERDYDIYCKLTKVKYYNY